ncbi:hypothetical protein [Dyadobacter psychrotolerans]|uniref:Uncharacterized protein n=1 Tax=Dyadobacter psychrotolerans TaxID=2541721 RepID=A0A4R5DMU4_9BACT|nr:hypothetical protein [Dyadobacter psychrotolerans]TDE14847.1 hypothetical protein E0F88_16845 [Dyadobacter psychrotolerans]
MNAKDIMVPQLENPTLSELNTVFQTIEKQNLSTNDNFHRNVDLSVLTRFMQKNMAFGKGQGNTADSLRQPTADTLSAKPTTQRIINILWRVINGKQGLSRQERIFAERFWSENYR